MSTLNQNKNVLNVYKITLYKNQNSIDGEKATNFEALHEKITGTEERLNDINEQTQKKFQIVKDNVNILNNIKNNIIIIVSKNSKTNRRRTK